MESLSMRNINSIWNDGHISFISSPSIGNSGGILTLWQRDFLDLKSHKIAKNWIAICGSIKNPNFDGCIINIYNSCDIDERKAIWHEIIEYCTQVDLPCLILGDFNEVLNINERGSNLASQRGIEDFSNFIHGLHLIEIPASTGWFTWFRGSSKSKLDRLLVSPEWISTFPQLQVSLLKRSLSDHCPLLISSSTQNWGPKPFRFQNMWLSHPGCLKLVKEV